MGIAVVIFLFLVVINLIDIGAELGAIRRTLDLLYKHERYGGWDAHQRKEERDDSQGH